MDEEDIGRISWRRLEFAGVTAFAVAVSCLFIGQAAEQYAAQVAPLPVIAAKVSPKFNAIDYATTGAVKSGLVVIGPCGDQGH
ncbi:MAG TPA: hypothetical protein VN715_06815 [Roseiarcus sp.]|nr:hypothetical protein [Roseiarcus sp.]